MQRNFLAFDLGAESGRAVSGSFQNNKLVLEEIHRFWNRPVNLRDNLYWDFPALMLDMQEGLGKFVRKFDTGPSGISCDSWGVDYGLLDQNGTLLGLPLHYRNKFFPAMSDKVYTKCSQNELYDVAGLQYLPFSTVYQLEYLQSNKDPRWLSTDKFVMIADLVNYFFCGEKVAESSLASTSNLYSATERNWSKSLIEKLGYAYDKFPTVVPSGTKIGNLESSLVDHLGLPSNCTSTPVIASLSHDTGAAVAAVPADRNTNWAYLSSGTWSLLGVELAEPVLTAEARDANFTNEGGAEGSIRFLKNIMGLWILQECRRTWEKEGNSLDYVEITKAAQAAPSQQSFINPDDDRFIFPGNMPERVQEYCRETGQPVPEGVGAIARCILESLALTYRHVLEKVGQLSGRGAIEVLHIVGGGGKNRLLNQTVADVIGIPVLVGPGEATATGNIMLQAVALGDVEGLWDARAIVANSFDIERYIPTQQGQWEKPYALFCQLRNR